MQTQHKRQKKIPHFVKHQYRLVTQFEGLREWEKLTQTEQSGEETLSFCLYSWRREAMYIYLQILQSLRALCASVL